MLPLLCSSLGLFGLSAFAQVPSKQKSVQDLFDASMSYMDSYYDDSFKSLYDPEGEAALRHSTVETSWYALGLLVRNEGEDAAEAEAIITKVAKGQYTDESKQWYGTYQRYPEEPVVGSDVYPAKIYGSWDPNWRGFVGTTFVMILEEYADLLSDEVQELMVESLRHAVEGDTYRVGGVDGDNLYPGYSNPAIMRSFTSTWLGNRIDDDNMTTAGEAYANEIIELFNITDTLSEYNSGTYTGISLFGLTLWSKYLPESSVMSQMGPVMVRKTWERVAELWHPDMKNLAGPWDRTYGFDMNRYFSIMGLWFWAYLGQENSSIIKKPRAMSHTKDHAWGPVITVLADTQAALLPAGFLEQLKTFQGEHVSEAQVYYPPYDYEVRNVTTWLSEELTIGAQSYNQSVTGGPTGTAFSPAVVQWTTGDEIGWLTLRPSESALQANVSEGKLSLTYPNGDAESKFTLAVSTFLNTPMISSLEDVPGLSIKLSGNVNPEPSLVFGGAKGGEGNTIQSFEAWIFEFTMPAGNFSGLPNLVLDLEKV